MRTAFQQADGEQEARTVSELVERFFERFPRADLFGYGAYEEATIIGCLFFSRLQFAASETSVFLLSPMAVHPDFQGKGIGQNLIRFAHSDLRQRGEGVDWCEKGAFRMGIFWHLAKKRRVRFRTLLFSTRSGT